MIQEFHSECLQLKVYIDDTANTVKIQHLSLDQEEEHTLLSDDIENITTAMAHPGFAWGSVMLQIGRAINRALGGGSSAS